MEDYTLHALTGEDDASRDDGRVAVVFTPERSTVIVGLVRLDDETDANGLFWLTLRKPAFVDIQSFVVRPVSGLAHDRGAVLVGHNNVGQGFALHEIDFASTSPVIAAYLHSMLRETPEGHLVDRWAASGPMDFLDADSDKVRAAVAWEPDVWVLGKAPSWVSGSNLFGLDLPMIATLDTVHGKRVIRVQDSAFGAVRRAWFSTSSYVLYGFAKLALEDAWVAAIYAPEI